MTFTYEYLQTQEEIRKHIQACEGKHTQQAIYSTFHDALTQVCYGCKKIRTTIYVSLLQDKGEEKKDKQEEELFELEQQLGIPMKDRFFKTKEVSQPQKEVVNKEDKVVNTVVNQKELQEAYDHGFREGKHEGYNEKMSELNPSQPQKEECLNCKPMPHKMIAIDDKGCCAECGRYISYSHCSPTPEIKEWEKEFDKKFMKGDRLVGIVNTPKRIKSFIADILHSREQEIKEKIKGMRVEHLDTSDPSKWGEEYTNEEAHRTSIHNRAINRVLEALEK